MGISRPLNFQLPISPTAPVAMFAGGSGIAPFHGFLKSRFDSSKGVSGRNVLFLGVQSRKKFLYERELRDFVKYDGLELHTAFSRDTKGLVCEGRNLIEKEMENRYLDAAIIEQGGTVADIVMPTKLGGLGGYLYVCGSMAVYETVIKGIKKAIYNNRMATQDSAEAILAIAFAERRFMLDIFMTPKAMSFKEPTIPMSTLARNTGHRAGEASREFTRTWIGVHGAVYDVTDFLPIHPGGSLIVSASAGLDASRTFDDLAHTSNPEVMSLLSKYFIGYLAPKHDFRTSPELRALYVGWSDYLRTSVENLTTLSLEVKSLKTDATTTWFSGGLLNMTGVNKFHQFQIRLLKNGFPSLFGPKLQELYLKLSFALVSSRNAHSLVLPDVMGIVARAQSSVHSAAVLQELSQIGDLACDPSTAQSFERGIIHYAQAVTELDVKLLEQVREEICTGMDAFDLVASTAKGYSGSSHVAEKQKLNKVAAFLVSLLEKIAERLDTFYVELSALSLYRPEIEGNPARARWRLVKRRIADGSFFLYTQELSLETALEPDSTGGGRLGSLRRRSVWGGTGRGVTFDQVVAHASSMVKTSIESAQSGSSKSAGEQQHFTDGRFPGTLADAHSMRAESANGKGTTSYESMLERKATLRTKRFLAQNSNFLEGFGRQPGSNNAGVSSQEQPQYIDDSSANQQQLAPDKHRLFDRDMMQLQQQQQQQQQQAIGTSPLEYQRSEVFSPRGRANTIEIQRPPLQDKSFAYSSSTSQDNGPKNLAPQTTFYNIASANSSGVRLSESPRIRSGTFNGSVAGRQSPRLSNHGMAYTPEREAQPQSHHNYGIPSVEQQQQHRIDSPSQSAYHPRPSSSYSTPSEQEAQPRPNSGSFGTNNMKSENVFDRYEREPAPPRTRSGFLERSLDILTAGSSARNISKDRSATQLPSTTGSPRNFPSPSLGSVFGAMLVGTSAASIGGMDSRSVTSGGGYPNGQGRASPPGSLFSGPEGQSFSPPRGNYQTQGSPNPNYYQQAQPIPHPSPQPQYHFQKVPNMTDRTRPRGASANYSAFNPRGVGGPGGSPQNVGNWGPGNTHPPTMVPNSMPSGGGPPAMHSSEADLLSKGLEALQRRRVS